ncbi:MAG: hypothetical protein WCK29_01355 [archaeon]
MTDLFKLVKETNPAWLQESLDKEAKFILEQAAESRISKILANELGTKESKIRKIREFVDNSEKMLVHIVYLGPRDRKDIGDAIAKANSRLDYELSYRDSLDGLNIKGNWDHVYCSTALFGEFSRTELYDKIKQLAGNLEPNGRVSFAYRPQRNGPLSQDIEIMLKKESRVDSFSDMILSCSRNRRIRRYDKLEETELYDIFTRHNLFTNGEPYKIGAWDVMTGIKIKTPEVKQ